MGFHLWEIHPWRYFSMGQKPMNLHIKAWPRKYCLCLARLFEVTSRNKIFTHFGRHPLHLDDNYDGSLSALVSCDYHRYSWFTRVSCVDTFPPLIIPDVVGFTGIAFEGFVLFRIASWKKGSFLPLRRTHVARTITTYSMVGFSRPPSKLHRVLQGKNINYGMHLIFLL